LRPTPGVNVPRSTGVPIASDSEAGTVPLTSDERHTLRAQVAGVSVGLPGVEIHCVKNSSSLRTAQGSKPARSCAIRLARATNWVPSITL
jgi:hypothetical protein